MDLYHYRVVVFTHCQHTFQFKHLKVNLASDDPFKFFKFKFYKLFIFYLNCFISLAEKKSASSGQQNCVQVIQCGTAIIRSIYKYIALNTHQN